MSVFVSRPKKIVTFPLKNGNHPKCVVVFLCERNTFRKQIMEIVMGFDEKKLRRQRQTLEIVGDLACENKNPRNILRFRLRFFFIFLFFLLFFVIFDSFLFLHFFHFFFIFSMFFYFFIFSFSFSFSSSFLGSSESDMFWLQLHVDFL